MDFLRRRSIRKYTGEKIQKNVIDEILETALASPSGRNLKPWEFIVVEEKSMLDKLSHCKLTGSGMLHDAALAVVVLGNSEVSDTWVYDCTIAAYNIQLKAYDLNLGSCWVHLKNRTAVDGMDSEIYVRRLLNIPEKLNVATIISIGYPDEIKAPHKEEELDFSKVHYEKF